MAGLKVLIEKIMESSWLGRVLSPRVTGARLTYDHNNMTLDIRNYTSSMREFSTANNIESIDRMVSSSAEDTIIGDPDEDG